LDEGREPFVVGDIERGETRRATMRLDGARDLGQRSLAPGAERDMRTLGREPLRDRRADALARTGDDCYSPLAGTVVLRPDSVAAVYASGRRP
jgi:hypothetical protein